MDYLGYFLIGVLGLFIGFLIPTYTLWRLKKDAFFEQIIENVINDLSNDKELQENLYNIGGIIGQGAKTGIGINFPTQKSGRFNLQNFLLEMAGQFIQQRIQNPSPSPQPSLPLPNDKGSSDFFK
jgi:hypothetical protein